MTPRRCILCTFLSGVVGGLIGAAVRLPIATAEPPAQSGQSERVIVADAVIAKGFVLTNEEVHPGFIPISQRNSWAGLGLDADGRPLLRMYDSKGKERLCLGLDGSDSPTFSMKDQQGRERLTMGLPLGDNPSLNMFGEEDKTRLNLPRLSLSVGFTDMGMISLGTAGIDDNYVLLSASNHLIKGVGAMIGLGGKGAVLGLSDEHERARWTVSHGANGVWLRMFDEQDNLIWKVP